MVKVVIIDDEPMIVRGISALIENSLLDLKIVGTAENGEEGLQCIEKYCPDIVISDISMPKMSGLDLLKHVKEVDQFIKVIFITAYRDFDYAQKALQYGATDFLLKPIKENELIDRLRQIMKQIQKEKSVETTLGSWIENKLQGKEVENLHPGILQQFRGEHELLLLGSIQFQLNKDKLMTEERQVRLELFNQLDHIFSSYSKKVLFFKTDVETNFLLPIYSEDELDSLYTKMDVWKQSVLTNKVKLNFTLAPPFRTFEEILDTFHLLKDQEDDYYFQDFQEPKTLKDRAAVQKLYKELVNKLIYQGTVEECEQIVNDLLDNVPAYCQYQKDDTIIEVIRYTSDIVNKLSDQFIEVEGSKSLWKELIEVIRNQGSFLDLKDEVLSFIRDIVIHMQKVRSEEQKQSFKEIITFIETNYRDNITLEQLAELAFMNKHYFSGYFKKMTGENFKAMITRLRMEEAARLLLYSDKKIYTIAHEVGYMGIQHFNSMFQKYYQQSPSAYRQSGTVKLHKD